MSCPFCLLINFNLIASGLHFYDLVFVSRSKNDSFPLSQSSCTLILWIGFFTERVRSTPSSQCWGQRFPNKGNTPGFQPEIIGGKQTKGRACSPFSKPAWSYSPVARANPAGTPDPLWCLQPLLEVELWPSIGQEPKWTHGPPLRRGPSHLQGNISKPST